MATTAQFASTPKTGVATISTANAGRDGTGVLGTVVTAGASGSRIDKIVIVATGTTTAGMVRLFIHDGATAHLLAESPVFAIAPSATQESHKAILNIEGGLVIPSGYSLRAATEKAETFKVFAFGGDF